MQAIPIVVGLFCATPIAAQNSELARAGVLNQRMLELHSQGRYADAEALAREILTIREEALGPNHPDVAASFNNLAFIYQTQERYAEAEPLYKRGLAIIEKALGPEHPSIVSSLGNLADLYRSVGRDNEAEPLLKRMLAIQEKVLGPEHPAVAITFNNLASLYIRQGRYADAEPLYRRSLAILEKTLGLKHPNVATSLNNLAGLYVDQGRYADAEPLYTRSLAIMEESLGPKHPHFASSLNNLALLYARQGQYADAEPLYKRSLAILEEVFGRDHPDVASGLNNLADLYRQQERYAEAERLFQRSLALREKAFGPTHPDVADSLNNLAQLYDNQGRYTEAEPLLKRSLAIWEDTLGPRHPDVALGLHNLAALYRAQGRNDEAYSLSARALDILTAGTPIASDSRPDVTGGRYQLRAFFLLHVALAFEHGKAGGLSAAEAFQAGQLAATSSAAKALAGMAARFAGGTDALAGAVRERQDLQQRWQRLDKAIVAATSKPPEQRGAAAETALRQDFAEAEKRLNTLDARIAREFPQYAQLSNPKPLQLNEAQALLKADEVMLVYTVGTERSWLWAIRRDQAELYKLDIGAKALTDEVTKLRERLDPTLNPDLTPFDAKRAYALYEKIVMPAAPLLDGASQVFVVPDGSLQSLPLGVLVTREPAANPEQPGDHREIAWFARDHASTVLPSVGALQSLRSFAKNGQADAPFVGFGNPVLEGKPGAGRGVKPTLLFRGMTADVDAVRQLPPLPETADELRAVARATGAGDRDLYLAERASEPLLREAALDHYRVIEFATHGLMSGDLQGLAEPALVLTPPRQASPEDDGLLTASKVATLKLNADWVVLSACNTAASDGTPDAGGLSGLAKAFFYAGARSLLVSHWSVPSRATVKLITGAFDALKKDPLIGRAEALRRSGMAMLDVQNPPEYAHPMMWAAFVLAGEGGAGR